MRFTSIYPEVVVYDTDETSGLESRMGILKHDEEVDRFDFFPAEDWQFSASDLRTIARKLNLLNKNK